MNLETLTQKSPFITVVIGDFNAKSKHWSSKDSTNPGGGRGARRGGQVLITRQSFHNFVFILFTKV